MKLFDTHTHLHFPDYEEGPGGVVERARESGVDQMLTVGTTVECSRKALETAALYEGVYASAGVHPHDAKDANDQTFVDLEALLGEPKVVAIGEVGLDFFRDHSPHDVQETLFLRFLELYKKTDKPLIIHCRDAYERLIEILQSEKLQPYHGVIHCFSGTREPMKKLLDLGFMISFAGPLTYKKNDELRAACAACPKDLFVLETDAPYLSPQSRRGKRNESAFMVETAETAARVHTLNPEELGRQTTANAMRLFGL